MRLGMTLKVRGQGEDENRPGPFDQDPAHFVGGRFPKKRAYPPQLMPPKRSPWPASLMSVCPVPSAFITKM